MNKKTPEVEFVNHACFLLEYAEVTLIVDPWLTGNAFNNGWDLLIPTPEKYLSFDNVTHIWFSHEHPDHFSPSDLKRIPATQRSQITVLFQETMDRKVVDFCHKLGFIVEELPPNIPFELCSDFSITCAPFTEGDSWCYIQAGGLSILNVNDCILTNIEDCEPIKRHVGEVDILFTQFGYANWVGNPDEVHLRKKASTEKLERIRVQSQVFRPAFICPFASMVYFSHEENFYMNDAQNTIMQAYSFIQDKTESKPLVLFPGDSVQWPMKDYNDGDFNQQALNKYKLVYEGMAGLPLNKATPVEMHTLVEHSIEYGKKLANKNPTSVRLINRMRPKIFLEDLQKSVTFYGVNGIKSSSMPKEDCDIIMSSGSLDYFFRFEWGGDTLNVNARFRSTKNGDMYRWRIFSQIGSLNNHGVPFVWHLPSFSKRLYQFLVKLFRAA